MAAVGQFLKRNEATLSWGYRLFLASCIALGFYAKSSFAQKDDLEATDRLVIGNRSEILSLFNSRTEHKHSISNLDTRVRKVEIEQKGYSSAIDGIEHQLIENNKKLDWFINYITQYGLPDSEE